MSATRNIAVVVGSLRKDSLNRKMARAAFALSPVTLAPEIVEIGALPLYNMDLEGDPPPAAWAEFRQRIKASDGVLFVTPEFNRSVPGALKNAIDVGSRPSGKSAWSGKPCAVISVSPGQYGGFGANHHLRQSFVFLDMPTMQQPEAYIAGAGALFDDAGAITNERTRELVTKFMATFAAWVEQHAAK